MDRIAIAVFVALCITTGPAAGQQQPSEEQPTQSQAQPQPQREEVAPKTGTPGQPGGASRQGVPLPPRPRQAPFKLTEKQQQFLWAVLKAWEAESAKIQTLSCTVSLLEIDRVFNKKTQRLGELKFKSPDHGLYRIKDAEGREWLEHWLCDGKAVYQYDHTEKKVVQRTLPPELQGQGIANGPLPFLFGADANRLLARYWMRLVTPQNVEQEQVWIEAYPRWQSDAANFLRATVILRRSDLVPIAVELYSPNGKTRTVHSFGAIAINERERFLPIFGGGDPFEPVVPRGWTMIEDPHLSRGPASDRVPPPAARFQPASHGKGATKQ